MDDGSPATLEVGFAIDTGGSFDELTQLQAIMNSTEVKVVADAAKIERATAGMVNVSGATAAITSFGNAATRELQTAARETAKAEKAGESLSRQLDRQASTFGKTASEIRAMKVETAALAAEQKGLTELAGRLRAQEADLYAQEFAAARRATLATEELAQAKAEAAAQAEREAAALATAAAAAARDAREHATLAAMVRGSHDAQLADAAAAERMRMATDPLYAATKRLNAEIAESTRLYHQGATAPAEYARQQDVLTGRLRAATQQHELMAVAGRGNANSMKMMAVQLPDIAQGLLTGQKPMTIFLQQGGQLVQIAMMAEGGLKAMARQLAVIAAMAAPVLAVVGVAAGGAYVAFRRFQDTVKDDGDLTRYRDSLGLTRKEMEQLSDGVEKAGGKIKSLGPVTITFGDEMAGIWKTIGDQANTNGTWDSIKNGAGAAFDWILEAWMKTSAGITAGIKGTFTAIGIIWGALPSLIGNVFINAANLAIAAMNALVRAGVAQINGFIAGVNTVLPASWKLGTITAPQIDMVKPLEGARNLGKRLKDGYVDAYTTARTEDAKFWAQAGANAKQHAKDRMKTEADAIKANRTPKAAPKDKVDHNALNAEAVESQIKNLYKLADAYGVSGAAALVAEARVKAESDAIKKRGDVEVYVDRQIRLAIATRVSDAAKATAAVREQANAQQRANEMVAAGIMPADRAADYVKGQIEDLPLLAAIQVAQQRGLAVEAAKATAALQAQRQARLDLRLAEEQTRALADAQAAGVQISALKTELQLVGAVDAVRARSLATVRAQAEAEAKYDLPSNREKYVRDQMQIFDLQQSITDATRDYNDQLNYAADKWSLIASNMREAAGGLSDAFGPLGQALGEITARYADYAATRAKADQAHTKALEDISHSALDKAKKEAAANRENTKYALQSGAAQVDAYGDMLGAAKGFFSEKSRIYKALQAAEMAYRAIQLAMSIASMFQDTTETVTHVANAGARATANAAEGVSAQAKLPFPANIAAMAATAAAVVAFGIAMLGGRGGGSHSTAPTSSEDLQKAAGTGTVLGSPDDKSASIKNSLDLVARNTGGSLQTGSQMLDALRSIDASIGAMAATVAKQINVSGSLYDTTKLNIGSSGSAGFLGMFSSSTTRSLYDAGITLAATTVGNIVANGISGQTYQIVQQVKKSSGFLGIGGGTKTTYATTNGALPSDITASIQRVIGALENGIVTAAGQIGVDGAKALLDNFTVSIGQLSFNGLDAQGIEDQLNAVFSTVGDQMTAAVFPGIVRFQRVGEGLFETLSRVVSTVEAVTDSLGLLGNSVASLGIDAKVAIADQFDSVGDLTSAAQGYFDSFYTKEEQALARAQQFGKVFTSLGVAMPTTLAGFRSLVEAQDLTTAAGQSTYATLLKLAPAFSDLMGTLGGARSAADAADELRQAWQSIGEGIAAEVERIRGLAGTDNASFAVLQGRFNAATEGARAGDQELAKSLPGLSQALLDAAEKQATSRQELERIRAQTAASLEETGSSIASLASGGTASIEDILNQVATSQAASSQAAANDVVEALTAMNDNLSNDLDQLREDTVAALAQVAGGTNRTARILDDASDGTGSRKFQMMAGIEPL